MLRNAVGDYLDSLTERQFDLPFLLLLPTMDFYDAHYTHGSVEFGKDFIAKKQQDDQVIQYAFQSKAGNITQRGWRDVKTQLLEALTDSHAHPNFDSTLPHQVVLVLTGDLAGNAKLGMQDFNQYVESMKFGLEIDLWAKHALVDYLINFGMAGLVQATRSTTDAAHAHFLSLYGKALRGELSARDVEQYSKRWIGQTDDASHHQVRCALESEILAQQCIANGYIYEAVTARLAFLRVLYTYAYIDNNSTSHLDEIYLRAKKSLYDLCQEYAQQIKSSWSEHGDLLELGPMPPNTYLVQCSRIMELTSLAYFTAFDELARKAHADLLEEFVSREHGCPHPLSDRYVVSLVLATLVLCNEGHVRTANELLHNVAVWVFDRYEHGHGLAGVDSDELAETYTLFGYVFDFVDIPLIKDSLLVTALVDLTAFISSPDLYSDIVNDLKAVDVHPVYWQPRDSKGACQADGDDVLHIPSVEFTDELNSPFGSHGDHLYEEPTSFQFVNQFGPESTICLMALLRDRYFPTQWSRLCPNLARSS